MSKKSTQIALGGMFSALCLMLMFLTGMVPFSTYVMPAAAGIMLVPVMEENGRKAAVLVYVTVSVLSVFIVPDREAALMFIVLFGYYPITKTALDALRPLPLRILAKALLFNGMVALGYYVVIVILGLPDIMSDMGDLGRYSALILLGMGNVVFAGYDFLLRRYIALYKTWFRPTFLRR